MTKKLRKANTKRPKPAPLHEVRGNIILQRSMTKAFMKLASKVEDQMFWVPCTEVTSFKGLFN